MSKQDYYPDDWYQDLFKHMSQQHNLTLLQVEMDDLIAVVKEMNKPVKIEDDPYLVLCCEHGKVFQITSLNYCDKSIPEIMKEVSPTDQVTVVPAIEGVAFSYCEDCKTMNDE